MKKFKKYFMKNKKKTILMIVGIILFIFFLYIMFVLFISKSGSSYGNRLDGINQVKIKEDTKNDTKNQLKSSNGVSGVTFDLKGKLVNYIVKVNGIDGPSIKDMASKTLEKYSKEQLEYYDFQFFFVHDTDTGKSTVIGYKSKASNEISWTNNLK